MFKEVFEKQRSYFRDGQTLDINQRKVVLLEIKRMLREEESSILEALMLDLNKSPQEAYITEILPVMTELDYALKHLKSWTSKKRSRSSIFSPATSYYQIAEPKGQVLVVSPFNYPIQLSLTPVISAIAAGNTVILKVSELSRNTGELLVELISNRFDVRVLHCTDVNPDNFGDLLELPYNHIFFTGSTRIGKEIMSIGARSLTSMTLELGGKSPVVVHRSADLRLAARKIIWGKCLNAGQTCVAPDYLIVDNVVRDEFLRLLVEEIEGQFKDALGDKTYPSIINGKHLMRLVGILEDEIVYYGGRADEALLKMEPTIVDNPRSTSRLLKEEIFGPILPVIYFDSDDEVVDIMLRNPDSLALYLFTEDRAFEDYILKRVPAGGCCVNDVLVHLLSLGVPFGGRGSSGIGSYHGTFGFWAFSHRKTVCRTPGWFDLKLRYMRGPLAGVVRLLKRIKGW